MNLWDGKSHQALNVIANFLLLNALWLMMCLPVITIFPATTALIGVMREWVMKKEYSVLKPFFRILKQNFISSFSIGLIWNIAAVLLWMDIYMFSGISGVYRIPLLAVTVLVLISLLFTGVFVFPVMVHYKLKIMEIIKYSFVLSFRELFTTLVVLAITALTVALVVYYPITMFFLGSFTAYAVYRFCHQVFCKLEAVHPVSANGQE